MVTHLQTFWALYAVAAGLLAACLWMWPIALRSAKARRRTTQQQCEAWLQEQQLRQDFATLTRETLLAASPTRAAEGVGAYLQQKVDAFSDPAEGFAALNQWQQQAYAFAFVVREANPLSAFFFQNGEPLTQTANLAVQRYLPGEPATLFAEAYALFSHNANPNAQQLKPLNTAFATALKRQGAECFALAKSQFLETIDELL